ncbi:MAG: hypothetical protein GXO39_10155 [Thermotogae bacterium]|nr:hypothetical protein [Thermotogota bacterium]
MEAKYPHSDTSSCGAVGSKREDVNTGKVQDLQQEGRRQNQDKLRDGVVEVGSREEGHKVVIDAFFGSKNLQERR